MDKTQIFIIAFAMVFLAFRIYQKYIKKGTEKSETDTKDIAGSKFSSPSKDDDYEPYSRK